MSEIRCNIYLFIGPPGSGKGALSFLCTHDLGWTQLSTGNLCRKHLAEQTEIGKQIDFAMKSGKLVSDSVIASMVEEWLSEAVAYARNIILDGYPRTVAQAQALDGLLHSRFVHVRLHVIRFFISDEVVIARIGGRLVCQNKDCQKVYSAHANSRLNPKHNMVCDVCGSPLGKRTDDVLSAIQERLKTYHKHEEELLNFYRARGYAIQTFNVEKPLDEVFADFKKFVELVAI